MLKISVFNVSKLELGKILKRYKGTAWDQSPLFKKVYEEEFGQFGGEPFGCLVGDYYFDHSPPDVELLGEMSKVAAAAHSPFICGCQPHADADELVAGARQPARPDKIFTDAGIRSLALAALVGRFALRRSAMPRFLAGCPMAPRPARSRSSISRRRPPAASMAPTPGPTRPTRWR
jgi:type VI secretion system protein ImpC